MSDPLRPISNAELAPYARAGNGFSRLEDAEAVARARKGAEVIAKEGDLYVLYAPRDGMQLNQLASSSSRVMLAFVDAGNRVLNLDSPEGIRGVGKRLDGADLAGKASHGNGFSRFTHAESVARQLNQPSAIVARNGGYELFALTPDSAARLRAGHNDLLDGQVTAVVKGGQTLYNWGATRPAATPHPGFTYADKGQLMLDQQPYTIRGLNVYDLVEVGRQGDAELRQTLQLIADSGANSVRFLALSQHRPEEIGHIFDVSKEMGLPLKFIPVLGNHWQHVEAPENHFVKDASWYRQGFEEHYWPHAEATVKALMDRPEVLMWELMNEPESDPEALRGFADEVSTRIRHLYDQREAETGQAVPRHLIGLGTLGVGNHGDERPGMKGHDYKDLYGLPNLDVATVHDYTGDTLEGSIADFMHYARDLNKPFFLGEIGVKVRAGGTESQPELGLKARLLGDDPVAARQQALARLQEKIQTSVAAGSTGAMIWGPQPRGHAVDGDGYGFSYDRQQPAYRELQGLFGSW